MEEHGGTTLQETNSSPWKMHHFDGMKPRKDGDFHGRTVSLSEGTLQETNISHLGKRKSHLQTVPFLVDMLVPWRKYGGGNFFVEVSTMQGIYLELFWNNFLQEQRSVVFFLEAK